MILHPDPVSLIDVEALLAQVYKTGGALLKCSHSSVMRRRGFRVAFDFAI